jgi:hypothetical protein
MIPPDQPLNFLREVRLSDSSGQPVSEEYIIPLNAKKRVLELLYPFEGIPALDQRLFDLHEGKEFLVADFKVVWENESNFLVSPYYYKSGGTVIDWMPAEGDEGE